MSRSRSAIFNFLTSFLTTGVALLGMFVFRFLLGQIGEERLGASRMVIGWIGNFGVFEVGLLSALGPLLATALATDDRRELTGLIAAGLRAFLVLLGLSILAALCLLPFTQRIIPVDPGLGIEVKYAWCIGLVGFAGLAFMPFRALAEARQRGYRVNLALTVQGVVIASLSVLFATFGWGIAGQVAATTITALPFSLAMARDGLLAYPGLLREAVASRPEAKVWRSIARIGVPTFMVALCGRASLMTDNLIVGGILGAAFSAQFDASLKLVNLAQTQLQTVGNSCWAALADLHARGLYDAFNRRLTELTGLVALLGVAGLVPIVAYSQRFVTLWVGADLYLGDVLVAIAGLNAFLQGIFSLWFWCFGATGRVQKMMPMIILGAIVNFGLSITLTHVLGPIGPSLGTTLGFLTINIWYLLVMLRKDFATPTLPLLAAIARPLALGVPYLLLLRWLAATSPPRGWVALVPTMGVSTLTFLAVASQVVLSRTDREVWAGRLRILLGR